VGVLDQSALDRILEVAQQAYKTLRSIKRKKSGTEFDRARCKSVTSLKRARSWARTLALINFE